MAPLLVFSINWDPSISMSFQNVFSGATRRLDPWWLTLQSRYSCSHRLILAQRVEWLTETLDFSGSETPGYVRATWCYVLLWWLVITTIIIITLIKRLCSLGHSNAMCSKISIFGRTDIISSTLETLNTLRICLYFTREYYYLISSYNLFHEVSAAKLYV